MTRHANARTGVNMSSLQCPKPPDVHVTESHQLNGKWSSKCRYVLQLNSNKTCVIQKVIYDMTYSFYSKQIILRTYGHSRCLSHPSNRPRTDRKYTDPLPYTWCSGRRMLQHSRYKQSEKVTSYLDDNEHRHEENH